MVFEGEALSYAGLDGAAGRLARRLRGAGRGAGASRVGVCAERSLEMVVGLLAVLKAGGAYVPLDPDYPPSGWPSCWRTRGAGAVLAAGAPAAAGCRPASGPSAWMARRRGAAAAGGERPAAEVAVERTWPT